MSKSKKRPESAPTRELARDKAPLGAYGNLYAPIPYLYEKGKGNIKASGKAVQSSAVGRRK